MLTLHGREFQRKCENASSYRIFLRAIREKAKFREHFQIGWDHSIPYIYFFFFRATNRDTLVSLREGCSIHPHCNDPLKAYSVRSIRTDRYLALRSVEYSLRIADCISLGKVSLRFVEYSLRMVYIVYVIESAAYGVLFTSCLCQKPERARYERVSAFDTNNE